MGLSKAEKQKLIKRLERKLKEAQDDLEAVEKEIKRIEGEMDKAGARARDAAKRKSWSEYKHWIDVGKELDEERSKQWVYRALIKEEIAEIQARLDELKGIPKPPPESSVPIKGGLRIPEVTTSTTGTPGGTTSPTTPGSDDSSDFGPKPAVGDMGVDRVKASASKTGGSPATTTPSGTGTTTPAIPDDDIPDDDSLPGEEPVTGRHLGNGRPEPTDNPGRGAQRGGGDGTSTGGDQTRGDSSDDNGNDDPDDDPSDDGERKGQSDDDETPGEQTRGGFAFDDDGHDGLGGGAFGPEGFDPTGNSLRTGIGGARPAGFGEGGGLSRYLLGKRYRGGEGGYDDVPVEVVSAIGGVSELPDLDPLTGGDPEASAHTRSTERGGQTVGDDGVHVDVPSATQGAGFDVGETAGDPAQFGGPSPRVFSTQILGRANDGAPLTANLAHVDASTASRTAVTVTTSFGLQLKG